MPRIPRHSMLLLAAAVCTLPAQAANRLGPQDVAALAAACANCHGPDGRSSTEIPSLRGSQATHLKQRMLDFKAGKATDATVMTRLMKAYAEDEISALADWFAASATASNTDKEKRP